MRRTAWGLMLAVGWPFLSLAMADVVTLTDGSRLVGQVQRMSDGRMVLVTQFAGTIDLDATQIVTIQTDELVNVGMDTGDRLRGVIEWHEQLSRAVLKTELGDIPVAVERIKDIWGPDDKSPEVLAMEEQIKLIQEQAEAARAKWAATFEVGLLYKDGNSEIFNARGRMELRRKSDRDLLRIYAFAEYSEENKRRSSHEIRAGAYYEYLFTERAFVYGRMEVEYDEFERLDLRFSTGIGGGYYWIKEDAHELKTLAGLGYLHETYNTGLTRDTAEAELGLDYRLDVAPWARFVQELRYYPTFESFSDYRILSDSSLRVPLGGSNMWSIRLGARYEYKSQPAAGVERLDQTYYLNLVLDIE
ncbi:MAG: DUF481 domain-containing protein [Phycisphaerales bacterium]|nr:DUF481 domain-containing protein [Phycisphaerales bacterium]